MIIKRRGEVHIFQGRNEKLDKMFSKIGGIEIPSSDEIDYLHLPPHLGFSTPFDDSLIWSGYDLNDR